MKFRCQILLLISVFGFTSDLFGQINNYASFIIDSQEVVWVKVFDEPNASASELKEKISTHISQNSAFNQIESTDNTITARIDNFSIDYQRFNISRFSAPPLISSAKWFGLLKIDFKDEKYRVVLYRMKYFIYHKDHPAGNRSPLVSKQSRTLTDEVLNRDKDSFKKSYTDVLHVLHVSFIDSFRLRTVDAQLPATVHSQDW